MSPLPSNLPSTYSSIVLRERPKAEILPSLTDGKGTFSLVENQPLPTQLKPDQVLVKVEWVSVDPAQRGWLNDARSYVPPVKIGEIMRAGGVGRVVLAPEGSKFKVGDWVNGTLGWTEFAVARAKDLEKVTITKDIEPSYYLGALGMPMQTAYWGLMDVARIKKGERVVISGAAGAVGSIACQIALLKGCEVIAIAGGKEKCEWLRNEIGVPSVVDYKDPVFATNYKKLLGKTGTDVYFDNVGGEILDLVLTRLNKNARVALCGAISAYNTPNPRGLSNYLTLISQRAKIEGFIVFDYADRYDEASRQVGEWISQGKLKIRETRRYGLTEAVNALRGLFEGANSGKMVVKIAADGPKL
ncbi:NADP-dependent oxidoreductase [Sporobolomyces salmoneus]|uniref:NADP-dependent oxidoreductase n=1 Tax=Sporobolomyces salmoneus TaxID=183962 RepID=UPI003170F5BC